MKTESNSSKVDTYPVDRELCRGSGYLCPGRCVVTHDIISFKVENRIDFEYGLIIITSARGVVHKIWCISTRTNVSGKDGSTISASCVICEVKKSLNKEDGEGEYASNS